MNRYFYVPVTSNLVKHDGTSLASHLKMIDSELYNRGSVEDLTFYDSVGRNYLNETVMMYREKLLPERVVVVFNGTNFFYELASGEKIEVSSIEVLLPYEVSGFDVVDIFSANPEYKESAWNFFESYSKVKEDDTLTMKSPKTKKIGERLTEIFRRKTGK